MNDNTNTAKHEHPISDRAQRWLSLECRGASDTLCAVGDAAARELGRRTGPLPLAAPAAMLAFIIASPQLTQDWLPVALLFLIMAGAAFMRMRIADQLSRARREELTELARDYQACVDLTAFSWGALIGVLLLVHGIDRLTELALVATVGLLAGAFTSLTLERTLWLRFNAALWLPLLTITGLLIWQDSDGAWLLLLVETLFAGFAVLQGQRMVRDYINGLITNIRLEDAVSKIADQRSELRAHRERLDELIARTHQLSYYDQLTGIGSRHHFHERLLTSIDNHVEDGQRFAVLYLDVDDFKAINDTFGHDAGDYLLKVVARRANALLRSSDFAARLGSDELALLVHDLSSDDDITHVVQRCRDAIQMPVRLTNRSVSPRVSIGIAVYPEDSDSAQGLLKAAESAMNAAKHGTKSHFARYFAEMSRAAEQRLTIEQELRQALEKNQFELHYQPQFDIDTGNCCGVEALVRWNHPERGLVPPLAFIPIAENSGLIDALGEWVLTTACRQAVAWFDGGLQPLTIAVNISPLQLLDPDLVATVGNTLAASGLSPQLLELEITESAIQTHADARSTLTQLRELGVRIALDDFGTGYSSLASLRELPIDRVKIDRSFVADILSSEQDSALLGTIIEMAHVLGSSVVAEGVEERAQAELLQRLRCDCVQGYYFSRPLPAAEVTRIAAAAGRPVQCLQHPRPACVTTD
ncbi:MAG: EAL domain-containing protein [Gammaproteobacteria bacterium]|nr:EAL domain-containing protein [Gammaproteobacteria bacterium]